MILIRLPDCFVFLQSGKWFLSQLAAGEIDLFADELAIHLF